MPILAILGTILSVGITGYSVFDIVSSGEWRSWGFLDWVINIFFLILSIFPLVGGIFAFIPKLATIGGVVSGYLSKLGVVGVLLGKIYSKFRWFKEHTEYLWAALTRKGGFLWGVARSMGKMLKYLKNPWVVLGLLITSSFSPGLMRRIYQIWGEISMNVAEIALDTVMGLVSDSGYGNPITEALNIISGAKEVLPSCFTAIWGAVEADLCFGMIVSTFHFLFLYNSISNGYRLYGKYWT